MTDFRKVTVVVFPDGQEFLVSSVELRSSEFRSDSLHFETLVFPSRFGIPLTNHEIYYERHFSKEEARFRHQEIVKMLISMGYLPYIEAD